MNLEFRECFIKDLNGKDAVVLKKLKTVLDKLESAASLNKVANLKKLKNAAGYYVSVQFPACFTLTPTLSPRARGGKMLRGD
jgi:hypothetical protein